MAPYSQNCSVTVILHSTNFLNYTVRHPFWTSPEGPPFFSSFLSPLGRCQLWILSWTRRTPPNSQSCLSSGPARRWGSESLQPTWILIIDLTDWSLSLINQRQCAHEECSLLTNFFELGVSVWYQIMTLSLVIGSSWIRVENLKILKTDRGKIWNPFDPCLEDKGKIICHTSNTHPFRSLRG